MVYGMFGLCVDAIEVNVVPNSNFPPHSEGISRPQQPRADGNYLKAKDLIWRRNARAMWPFSSKRRDILEKRGRVFNLPQTGVPKNTLSSS